MCASFMIKQRNPDFWGIPIDVRTDFGEYFNTLIVLYRLAGVVFKSNDLVKISAMLFSLVPQWSNSRGEGIRTPEPSLLCPIK